MSDRDAIDGLDEDDFFELKFNEDDMKDLYSPMSWLQPVCECGAEKARTTHARWCPLFREY